MLEFVNYSLKQLKQYASMIQESPFLCNDISLGSFLIWHPGQNLQFATYHNTFIVKMNIGDEPAFSYPYGDDVDGAIDALIEYCNIVSHQTLSACVVLSKLVERVKAGEYSTTVLPSLSIR